MHSEVPSTAGLLDALPRPSPHQGRLCKSAFLESTDAVPAVKAAQRPVRTEHYLHRFGSHATLLVVEWFPTADGAPRRRVRFTPWPGL